MGNVERWVTVASVPALAFIVGALALPHPVPVSAEKDEVDRSALGPAVSRTRPSPRAGVHAELGDVVGVVGADLPDGALSRGARLAIRFYFECKGEMERDWQIFVHIDARGGGARLHGDHFPVGGKYPTTLWQTGDFVADDWSMIVPRDAAAGVYDVYVGCYIGEERLEWSGGNETAHDGKNRVRVGSLVIQ
jgi:hypothetical protein